ncbi:hypothetical protein BDZ97DRAFT_2060962 [Flammula alnicola]|nr:hypothetical protein BDZ97DRAFT_2060962 [Flammula alnicola]
MILLNTRASSGGQRGRSAHFETHKTSGKTSNSLCLLLKQWVASPTPVIFIGYELENDALDIFQSQNTPHSIKALLQDIESETHNPASVVRYHDSDNSMHRFICCFADLRERAYTSKELDAIPIPAEFSRVPERVKTRGELRRIFAPNAMVISCGRNGKTRIDADVVIGAAANSALYNLRSSVLPEILASSDSGDA